MSGMLMNERFVAVFPSLVRLLGSIESAVLLQHLHWCSDDEGDIRVTQAQLAEETGLTLRSVERRIAWLRDEGWIEGRQEAGYDRTLTYRIDHERLVEAHPAKVAVCIPPGGQDGGFHSAKVAGSSIQKERTTSRSTSRSDQCAPSRHPSRAIDSDWAPRREFMDYLAEQYPHANVEESAHRFRNYHFAKQSTSKSWEALLENWVSNDNERAEATLLEGTDDLGAPLKQRKRSAVTPPPARPGDPDYFDPHQS